MPVHPTVKRYNKLVPKFLTWQSTDAATDSLASQHAELMSQAANWPKIEDQNAEQSEEQISNLESILKTVEAFMREIQIATGQGKSTSMTPEERKAARQAANKAAITQSADKASKQATAAAKKKKDSPIVVQPLPEDEIRDLNQRCAVWDRLHSTQHTAAETANQPIKITLPDGKTMEGVAGVTTPYAIAKQISSSKAEQWLIAKVTESDASVKQWDMFRPLERDCSLQFFDFDTPEGSHTYWHSSAHILGQAVERVYGDKAKLCVGPALEDGGFYYDVALGDEKLTPEVFPKLESLVHTIIKEKQPFSRLVLKKEEALEMFKHNQYKQYIISTKVPDGENCTAYRCGPLIDLCRGPHVPNSSYVKALAVTKNSSSYWLGDSTKDSLQRVYGISFPSQKQLDDWLEQQRQAEERDHRRLGVAQHLFMFHDLSPGSAFMLPHGTRVYNKLVNFMRSEYVKRGYQEVISPNIFNVDLWKTSGHYQNYKEHMFLFECEKQEYAMKPMNCPAHCLMFHNSLHSYKELPVRLADFGVLHRNEFSGALSGLTRVRRFQQDDAHIFCRQDQIKSEIAGVLDMLESVYGVFGFRYSLALSTRPEKYLGEIAVWDRAEAALKESLDEFVASKNEKDRAEFDTQATVMDHNGQPIKFKPLSWSINPADGAFYGPKIDIQLTDALNRKHQCATIQLDFQLPLRFQLGFKTEEGTMEHPVMIHRAILGSVERMMAVLIEHTGGKWPLWLSPRQVAILPVSATQHAYAKELEQVLKNDGLYVDIDDDNSTLNKKILMAQQSQYNLILVIGQKEVEARTVTIRHRDHAENIETKSIEEFRQYVKETIAQWK